MKMPSTFSCQNLVEIEGLIHLVNAIWYFFFIKMDVFGIKLNMEVLNNLNFTYIWFPFLSVKRLSTKNICLEIRNLLLYVYV